MSSKVDDPLVEKFSLCMWNNPELKNLVSGVRQ